MHKYHGVVYPTCGVTSSPTRRGPNSRRSAINHGSPGRDLRSGSWSAPWQVYRTRRGTSRGPVSKVTGAACGGGGRGGLFVACLMKRASLSSRKIFLPPAVEESSFHFCLWELFMVFNTSYLAQCIFVYLKPFMPCLFLLGGGVEEGSGAIEHIRRGC